VKSLVKYCIAILLMVLFSYEFSYGQDINIYILKAKALRESNKYMEAINLLSGAIDVEKKATLYLERADIYISLGLYDDAIKDLELANSIEPEIANFALARSLSLKGDAASAISFLEKNMKSKFKVREKEVLLEKDFNRISNTPEWKQFIRNDWYTSAETSISEIEYYISLGRTVEAKEILNRLKIGYPEDQKLFYLESLILYVEGNYEKAMAILSPLVEAEPYNVDFLSLSAKTRFAAGNYSGAAKNYQDLMEIGYSDASLLLKLAECYKEVLDYDKAISYVEIYLSLYPSNTNALDLAGTVERASGDYAMALRYFSRCLDENSDKPNLFNDRADTYFMLKSWELAANDYGMALDLDPGNAQSWLNKGIAHFNLQQTETGCYCLKMALKMGSEKALPLLEKNCK
jgi:tetratricopeptide (TPR) repeat protein